MSKTLSRLHTPKQFLNILHSADGVFAPHHQHSASSPWPGPAAAVLTASPVPRLPVVSSSSDGLTHEDLYIDSFYHLSLTFALIRQSTGTTTQSSCTMRRTRCPATRTTRTASGSRSSALRWSKSLHSTSTGSQIEVRLSPLLPPPLLTLLRCSRQDGEPE